LFPGSIHGNLVPRTKAEPGMKIEKIRLKNFKAFQDVEIRDIPNFCVFVGANGVGKSTLFDRSITKKILIKPMKN
jgi:predicted ATP-binding protein involved in virulence